MRRVLAITLSSGLIVLPHFGMADSDTSSIEKKITKGAVSSKKDKIPKEKAPLKSIGKRRFSAAEKIGSSDPATVAKGINDVIKQRSPKAVRALVQRIRGGLPPALLEKAIDALATVKSFAAFKELTRLATHRRVAVRMKVAEVLGEMRRPAALKTLKELLDDQEAKVRGAAAKGLKNINARKAMNDLIIAAKRQVPEAAQIVGAKAGPHHIKKVLSHLDEESFEALAPILSKVLERKNVPKRTKKKVVEQVAAVGGDGAASLLLKYASSLKKRDPMREEITENLEKYSKKDLEKVHKGDGEAGENTNKTGGAK